MFCEQVELGFVISLRSLRDVFRSLNAGGVRWWLASDPASAVERGYMCIGYGCPECLHPLNVAYYRMPILNAELPRTGTEGLVVVVDSSLCIAEQPGYYFEDGKLVPNDALENFNSFFSPIQRSLLTRMQARC